jgi:hypothetical protein
MINVYVRSDNIADAQDIARREATSAGWHITAVDRIVECSDADLPSGDTDDHLKQARIDGTVVVVHEYPLA